MPSGMVTSLIKVEASVHVEGPDGVAEGFGVTVAGSAVRVGITAVGLITSVAVACAIFCSTLIVMFACPTPSLELVALTVMVCVPGAPAVQFWMTENWDWGCPFGVGLF